MATRPFQVRPRRRPVSAGEERRLAATEGAHSGRKSRADEAPHQYEGLIQKSQLRGRNR